MWLTARLAISPASTIGSQLCKAWVKIFCRDVEVEGRTDPSCSQQTLWTLEKQRKWFVYTALSLQRGGVVEQTLNLSTNLVTYYLCGFRHVN